MAVHPPKISVEQIRENFRDIAPAYTSNEAVVEAARCLYCYDAPCIKACPTHINIPTFIKQIAEGSPGGAARTIFTENILGGACARACPTSVLCEGVCVLNDLNKKPVQIGLLQRHATDYALEHDLNFFKRGPDTGKKVAVIGAGPAGLSCAFELSKLGHTCVVYEASEKPGGLNTYGIAGYKLDTDFAIREVEYIKKIGIEILLNTRVGTKPSLDELLQQYDAVFLGVGLGDTDSLGIEGETLEGCVEALDFIAPTRDPNFKGTLIGDTVLVIGGGNTAIDAATAAVRLGAETVTIVYRRTAEQMPAFKYEFELAKTDGVQFRWLTSPKRVLGEKGKVTGLECLKLNLTSDGSAKSKLAPIAGSEHVIACDMVIKALGQNPLKELLGSVRGLELTDGKVVVNAETYASSIAGLFAGGDCINGGGEVVDAVQHGKLAARGINSYLSAKKQGGRR